eukprot:m.86237 g.86237  ORF g.86237 m.86237 type:complete len:52 (+) comp11448_c0_seq1:1449-1604(+)
MKPRDDFVSSAPGCPVASSAPSFTARKAHNAPTTVRVTSRRVIQVSDCQSS